MLRFSSIPRPLLVTLAVLLAVVATSYSAIWMYYVRWEPKARLGIEVEFIPNSSSLRVIGVSKGTPAERVGLHAGDDILAINGRPLVTRNPLYDSVLRGQPGDVVHFAVKRAGIAGPLNYEARLEARPKETRHQSVAQKAAGQLIGSFPVLFLAVSIPVLLSRLEDRNAWLLALLFASFIAGGPILSLEPMIHPALRGFALAYSFSLWAPGGGLFYYFFAVFPTASPIDRRFPWLKTLLLLLAAAVSVPLGLWAGLSGSSQPLFRMHDRLGHGLTTVLLSGYFFGVCGLGLVSLSWNFRTAGTLEARRKTRVIVWGTLLGLAPFLLVQAAAVYAKKSYLLFPFWVWAPAVLALFLFPLSIAYAVVKHRVLEIPVLLKRSARYFLVQRGFVFLQVLLSMAATIVFALAFSRFFQSGAQLAIPAGLTVGVIFGSVLAMAGVRVHKRVTQRIDRAFFRSAYDARLILEYLAEKTRTATTRQELATLLGEEIRQALHPQSMAIYERVGEGQLRAVADEPLQGPETIPGDLPLLADLARRGQPWEVPPLDGGVSPALSASLSVFAPLQPECFVPMRGRESQLAGLLVLGPRLSEEPYSREDKRLLASVASQAGIALESIRLAEQMAQRMEAERRALHEIEMARQVQARLFPQKFPSLQTLEYAGRCIQARQVGGDYYDFLELSPGRLGLVLADIAGKGFSGALLMANLQANLRSQYAVALEDLPRLLESVNRLFYENSAEDAYATLFFADYEDATKRFRYANCGHLSPLLLRADGSAEWLESTSTVLGLFEKWQCHVSEVELASEDTLVLYSDGVTEAASDAGEEFGRDRLLDTVRANSKLAASALLEAVVAAVQDYSGREQADDLTLVVARCRSRSHLSGALRQAG